MLRRRGVLLLVVAAAARAQEAPFVEVTKFQDYTPSLRTNICGRQNLMSEGKLALRDALQGLNLTVAMTNYKIANEDKFFSLSLEGMIKETDPGLFVVMMDEVARRAGFSWRNSFAAIDPLDSETDGPNVTWTDLLKWEVRNFDIAADYWARSAPRMAQGIAFPKGWYDGSVVLAHSLATTDSTSQFATWWSFLLPFHAQVWVLIICATIFTGLMYFVLERLNVESDVRELEHKPMVAIFLSALTFTGHFEFWPNTNAARLLSFSWTFWALIITSAYTANMASFLVSKNQVDVKLSTLEDALKTSTPVCVQTGSVMDEVMSRKYPEMVFVRKNTEQELFDSLRLPWYGPQKGCGVAITNMGTLHVYQGNKDVNWDCSLTSEKRVVQHLPAGFATAVDTGTMCTSLLAYVMNLHFTEMTTDGFIKRAWLAHVKNISSIDCSERTQSLESGGVDDNKLSLKMSEMAGLFLMHFVLTLVAFLFALVDLLRHRNRRREMPPTASSQNSHRHWDT